MWYLRAVICVLVLAAGAKAFEGDANAVGKASDAPATLRTQDLVEITAQNQYDQLPTAAKAAVAVRLKIDKNWHFYSDAASAPGGEVLKITPYADSTAFKFSAPIIPKGTPYKDELADTTTNVITGDFTVYVPYEVSPVSSFAGKTKMHFVVEGALCSAQQCRMFKKQVQFDVNVVPGGALANPKFTVPEIAVIAQNGDAGKPESMAQYGVFAALVLAFAAGLILNIMPCVLPVIPLKVLSIFEQGHQNKARCIALGLAFCGGILLFFACIAIINIILRVGYGSVFQWGDHFRSPVFVIAMAVLMEVLAMIMFGVLNVNLPAGVAGKVATKQRGGYSGSVGMGFLAALLSTPCSFAILTAAFAWAQTQVLWLSTIAIMMIGVGMAAPYIILTAMPGHLKYIPKPGRWMEIFKQAMGFVLLVVAVWLVSVLPGGARTGVLYYGVIVAWCVWMWGQWISFDTAVGKKFVVRGLAVIIAILAGWWLLPFGSAMGGEAQVETRQGAIKWQPYDAGVIEAAVKAGRPVLVEWTADWCLTCKAVEKTVYARKDIAELIAEKNVLTIKADTTWAANEAAIDLQKMYNEPGVPVTMVFVPGQNEPVRLHGLVIGEELKRTLENIKN